MVLSSGEDATLKTVDNRIRITMLLSFDEVVRLIQHSVEGWTSSNVKGQRMSQMKESFITSVEEGSRPPQRRRRFEESDVT